MVNKKPVQNLIFSYFRRRAQDDLLSWDHLVQQFVLELKREVQSYYGSEGSEQEKQYPGFNYKNSRVRSRLNRWPYHHRLFRAFDVFDLSDGEMDSIAVWWGTARDREIYECQSGLKIRDTTGDEIPTLAELLTLDPPTPEAREDFEGVAWNLQETDLENMIKDADQLTLHAVMESSVAYGLPPAFHPPFVHMVETPR